MTAPEWWLEIARAAVAEVKGLVDLGEQLAKLVHRSTPWSHTVLSRFVNGEQPTQELAIAISTRFGLPRPFYIPRDVNEARAMQAVADLCMPPPTKFKDTARIERERQHVEQLEALEGEARQSPRLQSRNEDTGRPPRRGPRGVHRGGQ